MIRGGAIETDAARPAGRIVLSDDAKATAAVGPAAAHVSIEPLDDEVRALAERRLAQIEAALGLGQHHFARADQAARQALDGAGEAILCDQTRSLHEALARISDPLLRLRLTELLAGLAESEPD